VGFRSPPPPVTCLIAGLGNPGSEYLRTRHNAGYLVVDVLARQYRFPRLKRDYSGRYAAGEIGGRRVGLLQPATYMNASGKSVAAALRALKLTPAQLLVAHDEIDLAFGRLQVRHDGGHGGHNGLRSLHELVGNGFDRVRLGVGRPPSTDPDVVADHVLHPFEESEDQVRDLVERAASAAAAWVADGFDAAVQAAAAP
jgi:peptidyl-tRNA hydrolase, PTH1 family